LFYCGWSYCTLGIKLARELVDYLEYGSLSYGRMSFFQRLKGDQLCRDGVGSGHR
jgi:hypothetical protein